MKHLHWLASCTVLNPLGTQVWWLWQYLCSEVRHTLGVILFCPLRVNITGYLWNLLTHSTHPLTGPHVDTICGLLELELNWSTTGGQQKTFDKMIFFFAGFIFLPSNASLAYTAWTHPCFLQGNWQIPCVLMQMKVHSPLRDCIATLETTSVLVNKMHVL